MRFKIDLTVSGEAPFFLPVNYQSEIASWIRKVLHFENERFVQWLREKSYLNTAGEYRLFTFSDLFFAGHKHQDERIALDNPQTSIILSFFADAGIEPFIHESFAEKEFKIGDMKGKTALRVEKVTTLGESLPGKTDKITMRCLSPMLIAEPGKPDGSYLSPDQKEFEKVFFKSLMAKYAQLLKYMPAGTNGLSNLQDLKFELVGKAKARVVKIKMDTPHQKSVKGYVFDFRIKAPESFIHIGLKGGFGDLSYLGFGCCEVKN